MLEIHLIMLCSYAHNCCYYAHYYALIIFIASIIINMGCGYLHVAPCIVAGIILWWPS